MPRTTSPSPASVAAGRLVEESDDEGPAGGAAGTAPATSATPPGVAVPVWIGAADGSAVDGTLDVDPMVGIDVGEGSVPGVSATTEIGVVTGDAAATVAAWTTTAVVVAANGVWVEALDEFGLTGA